MLNELLEIVETLNRTIFSNIIFAKNTHLIYHILPIATQYLHSLIPKDFESELNDYFLRLSFLRFDGELTVH